MSAVQVGLILLNLIVLPTTRTTNGQKDRKDKFSQKQGNGFVLEHDKKAPQSLLPPSNWEKIKQSDIFSTSNVVDNFNERPFLFSGLLVASGLISTAFLMYARRSAYRITLLPNDRVRFSSFSPIGLGTPPTIEVPLSDVSCVQSRHTKENFSILKVKGYWGYHLVNRDDGEFLEPQMYDEYLGYSRSWTKR